MIPLQEIFDDLAYGEFANVAVGSSRTTTLRPEDFPRIVSLVNSALTDLYTRFLFKEKEFDLYQRTGITKYYLRPEHVGNPADGGLIYLDGSGDDPIDNDIVKITKAYRSDGVELRINDARSPYDIFMPEPDIIKIKPDPDAVQDLGIISLVYQATYPRIIMSNNFDPRLTPLYIPTFLKPALLSHIAARYFVGKASNVTEGQPSLNSTFLFKYEAECQKIKNNSLTQDVDEEDLHFERNGFV